MRYVALAARAALFVVPLASGCSPAERELQRGFERAVAEFGEGTVEADIGYDAGTRRIVVDVNEVSGQRSRRDVTVVLLSFIDYADRTGLGGNDVVLAFRGEPRFVLPAAYAGELARLDYDTEARRSSTQYPGIVRVAREFASRLRRPDGTRAYPLPGGFLGLDGVGHFNDFHDAWYGGGVTY